MMDLSKHVTAADDASAAALHHASGAVASPRANHVPLPGSPMPHGHHDDGGYGIASPRNRAPPRHANGKSNEARMAAVLGGVGSQHAYHR